jgi:hypothetical protein
MQRARLIAGLVLPTLLLASRAAAEDPEVQQLRDQLRATVLQLRQLQDQQASAPQPATPTPTPAAPAAPGDKAKLDAAEARARAAGARAGRLQAELAKAQAENTALKTAADTSAKDLANLKTQYDQSADAGRALIVENGKLKDQLATTTRIADACQAKNDRLMAYSEELLLDYNRISFGHVVASREPFLALKRVQLENAAQDREDVVRANRCDARLDAKPPAPPAPQSGGGA